MEEKQGVGKGIGSRINPGISVGALAGVCLAGDMPREGRETPSKDYLKEIFYYYSTTAIFVLEHNFYILTSHFKNPSLSLWSHIAERAGEADAPINHFLQPARDSPGEGLVCIPKAESQNFEREGPYFEIGQKSTGLSMKTHSLKVDVIPNKIK